MHFLAVCDINRLHSYVTMIEFNIIHQKGGAEWLSRFVQHVVVLLPTNPTRRKRYCTAVNPVLQGYNANAVAAKSSKKRRRNSQW